MADITGPTIGGRKSRLIDWLDGTFGQKVGAVLQAGSAIIGNIRIDQTTPGTTNGVVVNTEPSGSGVITTPAHTAPTAGVATGVILAANASRLRALFINDSDTVVYLAEGVPAVLNVGIRLNPLGGSYEMSRKIGNLYLGAVNGISGIAGKVMLVTEDV